MKKIWNVRYICTIIDTSGILGGKKVEQNGLFQFSVDNLFEILLIFEENGTILYANRTAEEELEYSGHVPGIRIDTIFPGGFEMQDEKMQFHIKADGSVHDMMAYRENRTCFPTESRLLSYEDPLKAWETNEDSRRLYILTAYDTSAKQLLEKQVSNADREVLDAQKVKSEFVANVTHELRTPVNGILGNTQELLKEEQDHDKVKRLLMIERGCRDMHALINNILDFSKLEAGKFTLELRKFDFRSMIEYVKGNHSSRITEKGLDFSINVSPEVPECVIGDELRIVQILNNLISNAYKFTSVGGIHVEVLKTAQSGSRVELFFMVIDTGIGIAKSDLDKLFKSFSQVDASISRRYGGTGLGLNICKQLAETMGGGIHVESNEGRGSTFTFHIWVELPPDCDSCGKNCHTEAQEQETVMPQMTDRDQILRKLSALTTERVSDKVWKYGEEENREEIEKKMSKLILSVEMENWEKAEMFAEMVKQLVEEAPREVKSSALRMKMAVQKGDYDKSVAAFEILQGLIG